MLQDFARRGLPVVKILDLGAGSGHYWNLVAAKLPGVDLEVILLDPKRPEQFPMSSNLASTHVKGFLPGALNEFKNDEFDLVVAFDLIEHLTQEDGYLLLYGIERVSKSHSLLYTPNGFVWQPPSKNNPFNAHISGWTAEDFRKFGYSEIRGHAGLKRTTKSYALGTPNYSSRMHSIVSLVLEVLLSKFHRSAFAISAVKRAKVASALEQSGISGP